MELWKVEMHEVYFCRYKNSVIAENNYEERTMERYPNSIVPRQKTFKRLEANLKGFWSFKKSGNSDFIVE